MSTFGGQTSDHADLDDELDLSVYFKTSSSKKQFKLAPMLLNQTQLTSTVEVSQGALDTKGAPKPKQC